MNTTSGERSRAAHHGATLGLVAVACVLVGVGGARFGILPPFGGFLAMVLGLAVALAGLVTSAVGVHATRPHKGASGRGRAVRGLLMSATVLAVVLYPATQGGDVPRINDITTDMDDPPVFVSAATLDANRSRDMNYPGSHFAEQQRRAYPDLSSLRLDEPPAAAYDRVRSVLAAMPRTQVVGGDREQGRVEAVQTSALFRFADDIVVRIRPDGSGSRIDVRSKSRDGRSDLGANAARIREIVEALRASASSSAPAAER
jgi:uncharacterized protein (DUF1499 family)